MSGLWTVEATALDHTIDADLQARLAPLAEMLAPVFQRSGVVFHDHRGAFAPVVDDPERAHIHLHAAARGARSGADAPSVMKPFDDGIFSPPGIELARVQTSSSRSLHMIGHPVWSGQLARVAQSGNGNLFVALRPARSLHGEIDAAITETLALSCALHGIFGDHIAVRSHVGGPEPDSYRVDDLQRLAQTRPLLAGIARILTDRQLAGHVRRAVDSAAQGPRAYLDSRLTNLRQEREVNADRLAQRTDRLGELRRQRAQSLASMPTAEPTSEMLSELRAIKALPQVVNVDAAQGPGCNTLVVDLRPMTLGRHLNRERAGLAVLAPLRLHLRLGACGPMVRIEDPYQSMAPAAHVRSQEICFGNIAESLKECLDSRHYASAVQLMIGFLQTYDPGDAWGSIGRTWPSFDVEVGDGNIARLPAPPPPDSETARAELPATAAEADADVQSQGAATQGAATQEAPNQDAGTQEAAPAEITA